jgi:hypothetical protein
VKVNPRAVVNVRSVKLAAGIGGVSIIGLNGKAPGGGAGGFDRIDAFLVIVTPGGQRGHTVERVLGCLRAGQGTALAISWMLSAIISPASVPSRRKRSAAESIH